MTDDRICERLADVIEAIADGDATPDAKTAAHL